MNIDDTDAYLLDRNMVLGRKVSEDLGLWRIWLQLVRSHPWRPVASFQPVIGGLTLPTLLPL